MLVSFCSSLYRQLRQHRRRWKISLQSWSRFTNISAPMASPSIPPALTNRIKACAVSVSPFAWFGKIRCQCWFLIPMQNQFHSPKTETSFITRRNNSLMNAKNLDVARIQISTAAFAFLLTLVNPSASHAQDMPLSDVLIDGEDWKLVAEGYQFTDAACADATGNFYFADVAKGTTINKIGPDGRVSAALETVPKISGLRFRPDGRLYACTQGPKKQVVAFEMPSGKMTVLADNVQPNDLVVSRKGFVYFTETGKGQVTIVDAQGNVHVGATGIKAPNGITLSP